MAALQITLPPPLWQVLGTWTPSSSVPARYRMMKVHEIFFSQCFRKFSNAEFDVFHWSLAPGASQTRPLFLLQRLRPCHSPTWHYLNLNVGFNVLDIEAWKTVGSTRQKDITFQWNLQFQTSKKDGKMFHKLSPYFIHFFFRFSPNFPNDKTETVPVTGRCLQEHWEGQDFLLQWFFLCKNASISCTASASTDLQLRLCGTQTHLFSLATKVYDAKCFFCS